MARFYTVRQAAQRLFENTKGQDLIEYSLIAGFVAVAAGAIFPTTLMPAVSGIFSTLANLFAQAAAQGNAS